MVCSDDKMRRAAELPPPLWKRIRLQVRVPVGGTEAKDQKDWRRWEATFVEGVLNRMYTGPGGKPRILLNSEVFQHSNPQIIVNCVLVFLL